MLDFNSKEYQQYKDLQCREHNKFRHEPKNHEPHGHRDDVSNQILMEMTKRLAIKEGVALDLGCAEGFHTEQLKERFGEAYGIDINEESLSIAKKFGREYCQFGDIHSLPFSNEFFDIVFSHEVLEHSLDFSLSLSEVFRVLKKDGFLVFSVPNERWDGEFKREDTDSSHFSVMTPFRVRQEVLKAGFAPIYGYVYNLPFYNRAVEWSDSDISYPFTPHLHCIIKKIK